MLTIVHRRHYWLFLLLFTFNNVFAQKTIYEIINRNDLSFTEIQNLADLFIANETDTTQQKKDRKHFERWKFEQKFHLDEKGYRISALVEQEAFKKSAQISPLSSSAAWVELGPKSFTYTSGWNPGIGRVTSVAVNPTDTNIIYISSPGGGIWKTTNGGTSWTPLVDNNSTYMNVFNLAIAPSNTNTIYAAATGLGVIKSTDAGITWITMAASNISTRKILVHPTNNNKIFATSSLGIHESSNGGTSWTLRLSGVSVEDIEFKPGDPNIM